MYAALLLFSLGQSTALPSNSYHHNRYYWQEGCHLRRLDCASPLPYYILSMSSCFNAHFTVGETGAQGDSSAFPEVTELEAKLGFQIAPRPEPWLSPLGM